MNDDKLAGNMAVSPQEAPEVPSKSVTDNDGSTEEKPQEVGAVVPKKHKKVAVLVIAVLAVVALGSLVGLLIWQPWRESANETGDGGDEMTQSPVDDVVTDDEKTPAEGKPGGEGSVKTPDELVREIRDNEGLGNIIQPDGKKFYVFSNRVLAVEVVVKQDGYETTDYDFVMSIADELEQALKARGFEAVRQSVGITEYYINRETGVICDLGGRIICMHRSWYDPRMAELADGLYDAIVKAGYDYDAILVDYDEVVDSAIKPYQRVISGVSQSGAFGGAAGYFYRKSPEDEWQLFTIRQDNPMCEEYDTEDLKKAFAGEECWTMEGKESVNKVVGE